MLVKDLSVEPLLDLTVENAPPKQWEDYTSDPSSTSQQSDLFVHKMCRVCLHRKCCPTAHCLDRHRCCFFSKECVSHHDMWWRMTLCDGSKDRKQVAFVDLRHSYVAAVVALGTALDRIDSSRRSGNRAAISQTGAKNCRPSRPVSFSKRILLAKCLSSWTNTSTPSTRQSSKDKLCRPW